jgi:hypothetical protein
MKFSTFLASTAIAALLAVPAAAVTIDISGYNPGGDGAVTGALNLTVSGGTAHERHRHTGGRYVVPQPGIVQLGHSQLLRLSQ